MKGAQKLAVVGGFGHAVCVFDELLDAPALVSNVGIVNAYDGESVEGFLEHAWMRGTPRFNSLHELLDTQRPDVLVVSSRPDKIAPAICAGLSAGCHIITEKPLALDSKTLGEVRAAAIASGCRVMAMLSMRSLPAFIAAREVVTSEKIGAVVLVNTRKSYKWGSRPDWFNNRLQYGGTWPWIGIHNLDISHFVTGLRPVGVTAMHANLAHPDFPHCEDVATGIFDLENGAQMNASIDLCRPGSAATWGDDWVRIVGTCGVIEANGSTGLLTITREGAPTTTHDCGIDPQPIYLPFLQSLLDNRPIQPAEDLVPFELTRSALAARESADHHRPEVIPPFLSSSQPHPAP